MASIAGETWAYINGDDDFNGIKISKFNSALLMSLMEESHGEEYNDEQVNKVIQSLEAEINANMSETGHGGAVEESEVLAMADNEDGENCLASMEFEWVEMEMVTSTQSDEMNWCMDYCGNELDVMVDYGDFFEIYNGLSLEENGLISSLWHGTYEAVA